MMIWGKLKYQDTNGNWKSFDFPAFPPMPSGGYTFFVGSNNAFSRLFGATNAVFYVVGSTNWRHN